MSAPPVGETPALDPQLPPEPPSVPEELPVHNPATGEEIGRVPVHSAAEVRAMVERARAAQVAWGALSVAQRCARLRPVADLVLAQADELAAAITRENGKVLQEAYTMELLPVLELLAVYLQRAPRVLAPHALPIRLARHRASYLHYAPRGVVAVISPWNFPFSLPFGPTLFALLAGNAVVLKPSEVTPLIALKLRALFLQAGLDAELVQVATGRGATGAALLDAGVDQVCFTGSVATGRRVAEACARRLIPCTLELGGKAPAVVCADADVERTARALLWGAFGNAGQVCASVERAYVHQKVYPALRERVVVLTRQLRQGNPAGPVDVGACTFPPQVEKIRELLQDAVAAGAVLETGGVPEPGARFVAPTVITGVTQSMRVMREESFGPLLPLMPVQSDAEAVALANDSELGLLAYVFTADEEKGRQLAERIRAGTVMVNDVLSSFGMVETPWQGVKASGLGRTHSDEGLREMAECRHVNYGRLQLGIRELWWYPYSASGLTTIRKLIDMIYGRGVGARLRGLLRRPLPTGGTAP